jgi:hypothetical protein
MKVELLLRRGTDLLTRFPPLGSLWYAFTTLDLAPSICSDYAQCRRKSWETPRLVDT